MCGLVRPPRDSWCLRKLIHYGGDNAMKYIIACNWIFLNGLTTEITSTNPDQSNETYVNWDGPQSCRGLVFTKAPSSIHPQWMTPWMYTKPKSLGKVLKLYITYALGSTLNMSTSTVSRKVPTSWLLKAYKWLELKADWMHFGSDIEGSNRVHAMHDEDTDWLRNWIVFYLCPTLNIALNVTYYLELCNVIALR